MTLCFKFLPFPQPYHVTVLEAAQGSDFIP